MQGNDSYRLIVRRGPQPNQVYELDEDAISLGRDITNNLVINDREVSRYHLRLMRGAEGYTIEDLGSTNGTFINGKRLSGAQPLKNGDMISLGETVTLGYERVRADGSPAPAAPVTAPSNDNPYQPPKAADPFVPPAPAAQSPAPQQGPAPQPYQPPAAAQQQPYQPPSQQQPQQNYGQSYPQQQDPYFGQQQEYGQGDAGYYPPAQSAAYGTPPPPGYDYDPYKMRDEEETSPWRWVLIGCLGLMLFCCCITVVVAIAVDTLNLYCSLPVLNNVLEAVGLIRCG